MVCALNGPIMFVAYIYALIHGNPHPNEDVRWNLAGYTGSLGISIACYRMLRKVQREPEPSKE